MRRAIETMAIVLLFLALAIAGSGCASMGVQPWERDLLAQPGMQLNENPVLTALDAHIYFSKEATTGGVGFGGGGCGCN